MRVLLAVLLLTVSGCATTSPEMAATMDSLEAGPVLSDSAHAALHWQRAQAWVAKHSRMKIQTATDILIETHNVTNNYAWWSFHVMREPVPGGYRVTMGCQCGNMFGCDPSRERLEKAFYHYVETGEDVLDAGEAGEGVQ